MKKIIPAAIAAALLVSSASAAYAENSFTDVSDTHWALSNIEGMAWQGTIDGYDDGTFMPDKIVTRAEFAKMISVITSTSEKSDITYADVPLDAWYTEYVSLADKYLIGYDGRFMPDDGAKRKDVAAAIVRALKYELETDTAAVENSFSDIAELSMEEKQYIATAVKYGIMDGFDEGTFCPEESITRAQAAAILDRAFSVISVGNCRISISDYNEFAAPYMAMNIPAEDFANSLTELLIYEELAKSKRIELSENDLEEIEEYVVSTANVVSFGPELRRKIATALAYQQHLVSYYSDEYGITDDKINAYANEHYYQAKHILVEDKTLAEELLGKAKKGEDFDKLISENSTDPGSAVYTDGYIFTGGEMVAEFENCVKNTEIGGFGLCNSSYGYHVISRLPLDLDNSANYTGIKETISENMLNDYILKQILSDSENINININPEILV